MANVLIIDDERSIRLSFTSILRREKHDVDSAQNWEEARSLIQKKDYDLVFLDILMPKISGLKILQTIKIARPDTLVIIMTGEPTVESSQKALRYGAEDYLTKPVGKETLLQICARAVERKKLLIEKRVLEDSNKKAQERIEQLIDQLSKPDHDKTVDKEYVEMAKKLLIHRKSVDKKLEGVRGRLTDALRSIKQVSETEDAKNEEKK
jgi:DNA-binding NtrC family response regulator